MPADVPAERVTLILVNCTCLCNGSCPDDSWPASPVRGPCTREAKYHWFFDIPRTSLRDQQMCVHERLCEECLAWRREQTQRWDPKRQVMRTL
jgi:hypothetical protein